LNRLEWLSLPSTADIAANYWRDRGHPPLMKPPSPPPDQHIHDPDRLA
jgi:hypothetical protein